MTLILGGINRDVIVVAADGLELEQRPGSIAVPSTEVREKLFPVEGQPAVLAVCGQNRLVEAGAPLGVREQQRLVGHEALHVITRHASGAKIAHLVEVLAQKMTPAICHTLGQLSRHGYSHDHFTVVIFGFDGGQPSCKELVWRTPHQPSEPTVYDHLADFKGMKITHSGSGQEIAHSIASDPKRNYQLDKLVRANEAKMRDYIRWLHQTSVSKQDGRQTFGGSYTEVTITKVGCRWTTPS